MPAPPVASSGKTPDGSTSTQVISTDTCNVGDTLYIAYGSDAFDLAGMPEATSSAGTLEPLAPVDLGTNAGHLKRYLVHVASAGVKTVTFPAHGGGDIHGHWLRITADVSVDAGTDLSNVVATNTTSAHQAPSVDPNGTDRLLVCTWMTTSGPAFTGQPYILPGSMTKQAETGATPFSDMCTGTEGLPVDTPTGTRTATWLDNKRYLAASVALTQTTPGGSVTSTLALAESAAGSPTMAGAVTSPLTLFSSAAGMVGGGAAVSDVLCSSWANVADLTETQRASVVGRSDADLQADLLRASEILWALSGRRWYGEGCSETATLRSFPPQPGMSTWPYHKTWPACECWAFGTWIDGRLFPNLAWRGEHIVMPFAVRLPRSGITAVTSVTIDGDAFAAWRFTRSGWLERLDGQGWRMCNDSTVITYQWGQPPPLGGKAAAVELGLEFAKEALNLDDCRLPVRNISSVTRQGITYSKPDPWDFLKNGKTGLIGIDLWLSAVNPQATPQAATVWSPDLPRTMRS